MNKTNYQYKRSLKNLQFESNLIESVATSIINDFPNISLIKNNVEIINLICNIEEVSSFLLLVLANKTKKNYSLKFMIEYLKMLDKETKYL
jgi:hypothetical protein